jgi:hypothetical protein
MDEIETGWVETELDEEAPVDGCREEHVGLDLIMARIIRCRRSTEYGHVIDRWPSLQAHVDDAIFMGFRREGPV